MRSANGRARYADERRDLLIEALRARVAELPGVEVAAFSHAGQLSGIAMEWRIGFPATTAADAAEMTSIEQRVSPGFFAAMGTRLISGRDFTPADDERSPPVAIVNESFVRKFLPVRNPIGSRFFREGGSRSGELMEIVGVVQDVKWLNLRDDSPAMYYRPHRQMGGTPVVRFAVRTSGDPEPLARVLPGLAQSVDRGIIVTNAVPFREVVDRTLTTERLVAHASTGFGALALLIAAVGLYGVLAYSVARRRREIGVRIALGARPWAIERMFLTESIMLVAIGVAVGIPAAIAITRFASAMLFGLSPQDPGSIAVALPALTLATIGAAYLPARRAARIDPMLALREE